MFKIEITGETLADIASQIIAMAGQFQTTPAATEDKPATRRRAKAEPEAVVAAEQTAGKPTLVTDAANAADAANERAAADEGNANAAGVATNDTTTTAPAAASTTTSNEPTQEDKDALLKEATQFSQAHGHDALLAALQAVGAERFSAIPFAKYGDFRAAMAKTAAGASALS